MFVNSCEFCGIEEEEDIVTLYSTTQGVFCKNCMRLIIEEFEDLLFEGE